MMKSDGFYDYAWNPVEGCLHGCEYCYAKKDIERQGKSFEPTFYEERLQEPFKVHNKTIFCTHYCDLFGNFIPIEWIEKVIAVCKESISNEFIFITKNPIRYYGYEFPDNCILGVTVESSEKWWRVNRMKGLESRKMASIEPIQGSFSGQDFSQFELVVIGAMFGEIFKTKSEWVNSVKHQNIYYKPNVRQYLKLNFKEIKYEI